MKIFPVIRQPIVKRGEWRKGGNGCSFSKKLATGKHKQSVFSYPSISKTYSTLWNCN
jgi:hypothetical protein